MNLAHVALATLALLLAGGAAAEPLAATEAAAAAKAAAAAAQAAAQAAEAAARAAATATAQAAPSAAPPAVAAELPVAQADPSPAPAADPGKRAGLPTWGFGVSTGLVAAETGRLEAQGVALTVAILRGRLRFEPELGFKVIDSDSETTPGYKSRFVSVGAGILFEVFRGERSALYTGGRLGLAFAEQWMSGDSSGWWTVQSLSGGLGGEYYVGPFASVGLEATVGLDAAHVPEGGPDTYTVATGARLLVRFYGR